MKTLLNILLLMAVIIPCQAQKVKPALNLTKGKTYNSVGDLNTTITQTINGQEMNISIGLSTTTANKVIDIKDTVYSLELSFKSLDMKIQPPTGDPIEYNTAKPDVTNMFSRLLSLMVNKPFMAEVSKSGKILQVTGIDNMLNSIFGTIPAADSAQLATVKAQFTQSFGENAIKGSLAQTFSIYPSVKVAKGDSWTVASRLQSIMTTNTLTIFKLEDIAPAFYTIHGDGNMVVEKTESKVNGMPVIYDLKGTIVTDMKIDRLTGWIIESKLKQDVSGSFEIKDNPKVPGGMTVPMVIKSNAVITN